MNLIKPLISKSGILLTSNSNILDIIQKYLKITPSFQVDNLEVVAWDAQHTIEHIPPSNIVNGNLYSEWYYKQFCNDIFLSNANTIYMIWNKWNHLPKMKKDNTS